MAETVERAFSTPEGCDLMVKNVCGTVSVEGWERPETQVTVTKHEDWAEVQIEQEGRHVTVRTKDDRGAEGLLDLLLRHRTPKVDYAIRVPFSSNLDIRNVNGPIQVAHVRGNAVTRNVDGPTRLNEVSGSVTSETVNGPVEATQLQGEAKLKAVNGRLALLGGKMRSVAADAVNGEIDAQIAIEGGGSYSFKTVNGSCHLTIPSNANAHVMVHGVNSGVDSALLTRSLERSFGRWEATIGDAGAQVAEISFNTVNGRLRLDAGEAVAPQAAPSPTRAEEPAVASQPSEAPTTGFVAKAADTPSGAQGPDLGATKKQVLEMLDAGQITVDEALERLRKL